MIGVSLLALVLAVQLVALWRKCERLEREKAEIAAMAQARIQDSVNRILVLKGVRPIAEPVLERGPAPVAPSFSPDDLDHLRDMVKERIEVAGYRGEMLTEEQARREVWAQLGYEAAPVEL